MEAKRKPIAEVFSSNLRRLLEEKGATQADLSRYMGISTPTVNNWCKGKITPLLGKLDALCTFFLCSPSDLLLEHYPVVEEETDDSFFSDFFTEPENPTRLDETMESDSIDPELIAELTLILRDDNLKDLITDYLSSDERGQENIRDTATREAKRQKKNAGEVAEAC